MQALWSDVSIDGALSEILWSTGHARYMFVACCSGIRPEGFLYYKDIGGHPIPVMRATQERVAAALGQDTYEVMA